MRSFWQHSDNVRYHLQFGALPANQRVHLFAHILKIIHINFVYNVDVGIGKLTE